MLIHKLICIYEILNLVSDCKRLNVLKLWWEERNLLLVCALLSIMIVLQCNESEIFMWYGNSSLFIVSCRDGNLWCHEVVQSRCVNCLPWACCVHGCIYPCFWYKREEVLYAEFKSYDPSATWNCWWKSKICPLVSFGFDDCQYEVGLKFFIIIFIFLKMIMLKVKLI